MSDYINEDAIRRRVMKRMEEQQGLMIHAAVFIVSNVIVWIVGIIVGFPMWIPPVVTAGWGIGMFAHAASYWTEYGGGAIRRENTIQREIERERERLSLAPDYNKPKNDFSNDGELFYEEDDQQYNQAGQ